MSGHILSVGGVAVHLGQREVLQGVDGGHAVGVQDVSGSGVAGIGVELLAPGRLGLGGAEPLGEGLDSLGLLVGAAFLVQDAQILSDVVGAVVNVHQIPVLGSHGALQRGLGALGSGVDLAVQGGGVEGGDSHVALVQRIEAVLVGIIGGIHAVGAVVPQHLPAVDGHAAGGGGGIDEGVQQGGVDVGVGGAADLVLTIPLVAAVHDVGPVSEVQSLAVGAQLIGTVQHQHVLDDQTVGSAGISILADLISPGGRPFHQGQVLVGAVDDLAPAGLVQTEQDVAVLVLVGSLDGGGITGDDAVVVDGHGEAGVLGGVDQPGGALGGVGVGVDADGIAGIILDIGGILAAVISGSLVAAGHQAQSHDQRQQESSKLFHSRFSFFKSRAARTHCHTIIIPARNSPAKRDISAIIRTILTKGTVYVKIHRPFLCNFSTGSGPDTPTATCR